MANDFKNTTLVAKIALAEFKAGMILGAKVDKQVDEARIFDGKVGATAYIRRPIDFVVSDGATFSAQDLEEATVPITLDIRKHVGFTISNQDLTLKIEDATKRYIRPAMRRLGQYMESQLADQYKSFYHQVGTPGTTPGTFLVVAEAKAKLDNHGVPDEENQSAFFDPTATVTLANGLKAVFPQSIAKRAIERARIGEYGGFSLYKSQSIKTHTVGVNTGTPLVDGVSQETTYALSKDTFTQSLVTKGWTNSQTAILKEGDVFTLDAVYSYNRATQESTGELQQFVVRADANSGASTGPATFTISPPMIVSGPYRTVDAGPADEAGINVVGTGGTGYKQHLAFHPNAITVAYANLDVPDAGTGVKSHRESFEGLSLLVTRYFDGDNMNMKYRFDILAGIKAQNQDFGVRITG